MLKFSTGLMAGAMLLAVASWAMAANGVTYIGHEKVAESLAKGGNLVTAPDLIVLGAHRAGGGQVEVHDKETDVMYIVDGSATFVTGGKMIGGKSTGPGQMRGKEIQGGETHQLSKGDVMVVPAGIPHWFEKVPTSISYYVVKVLKP